MRKESLFFNKMPVDYFVYSAAHLMKNKEKKKKHVTFIVNNEMDVILHFTSSISK